MDTKVFDSGGLSGRVEPASLERLANVGDAKSLVIHPASTTHHRLDAKALESARISEGLVRLSVGLKDPDDLVEDLETGLRVSQRIKKWARIL